MLKQHDIASRTVLGDAGRTNAGFCKETNDCTVRATAEAFQVDYATAHAACKQAGRKDRKGLAYSPAVEKGKFAHLGKTVENPIFAHKRLSTILGWLNPRVNYIVRVKQHVFAVRGGKIQDTFVNQPGKIIRTVWEVQPHADRPGRCNRVEYLKKVEVSPAEADRIRWEAVWNWNFNG